MIKNELYPHVFRPIKVRGLTLKNRLQYAPTVVLKCSPEGDVTQEMLDYAAWQARTGVAYVTIGNTPVVHSDSSAWLCEMDVTRDRCIHGMNRLAVTVRENGAEMSVELAHAGRGSASSPGNPALAPSDVPLNGGPLGHIKAMNRGDMDFIRDSYVDCALRCRKAGLRIIMIHCAHNNLLAQFVSPLSNKRTDEYGGSLANRMRYPLEVLRAVREAVPDMVIECRVSAQEDLPDGLQFDESLEFMKRAQDYVDIMHVSRGNIFFNYGSTFTIPTYFKGRLLNVPFAQRVKQELRIPVAVVGNITSLAEAEEIIAGGKADIVVMAKSFMADEDLVHKSVRGHAQDVRPCIRCDWCGNANTYGTSMRCAINPKLGKDLNTTGIIPADKAKDVMVVGGGPAGMTAAITLADMGHRVTLYEKSMGLGGLLRDAGLAPFKEYLRLYTGWAVRAVGKSGAKVVLGTEVTPQLVERENPDAVIVACGSKYIVPDIPGIDSAKVVMAADAEGHKAEVGSRVVVCGGGVVGLECAVALGMEGKDVTVVDMVPVGDFARELAVFNKIDLMYHLEKYGVKLVGGRRVTAFSDEGVVTEAAPGMPVGGVRGDSADDAGAAEEAAPGMPSGGVRGGPSVDEGGAMKTASGDVVIYPADTYVIAMGVKPDRVLADELLSRYPEGVYVVGDCVGAGRLLADANQDAFHAAYRIR
ncbi:MAG: FAD-dependent oxidoreductase [Lachnospiraceae bacterium]|jgi:2,4-dienoyl-CoA reductase-like NADH-dependent reductase (Old Yellow Enzyme family)/thioredoxin reductase|nr:FAD-dependent oxidoreductase [Lachnospiraceae bacterium]